MNKKEMASFVLVWCLLISITNVFAGNKEHPDDTHYTDVGFFDVHVCNWPDRPPFYMVLYSTYQFDDVQSVEMTDVKGNKFAVMDLSKFRIIKNKNKPEKRVFINQIVQPEIFEDGWFSAKITMKNGTEYMARDFVEHGMLPIASDRFPVHQSVISDPPEKLRWSAIKGASYYQVFIKDKWDEEELIFSSGILKKPEIKLPDGLLEYGGYYSWRVHARDVNEDIKLGDFNQGSLSSWQEFSISN